MKPPAKVFNALFNAAMLLIQELPPQHISVNAGEYKIRVFAGRTGTGRAVVWYWAPKAGETTHEWLDIDLEATGPSPERALLALQRLYEGPP